MRVWSVQQEMQGGYQQVHREHLNELAGITN